MAVKTKTQLHSDTAALPAPITRSTLLTVLDDMIDSYEDKIQEVSTATRDALTPVMGQKIFNTDTKRVEVYSDGTGKWLPLSQNTGVILDASANPDYVGGGVGDTYSVTVAGKIGGSAGKSVYVGDTVYCIAQNAGGNEATVGTSWKVCHSASETDSPTFLAELTLSSAEILALNSTPKTLIAAPGAGKMLVPVSPIVAILTFNSAAYATNTSMRALWDDANALEIFALNAANTAVQMTQFELGQHDTFENTALRVTVNNGDPITGDSPMKISVYYKILTL